MIQKQRTFSLPNWKVGGWNRILANQNCRAWSVPPCGDIWFKMGGKTWWLFFRTSTLSLVKNSWKEVDFKDYIKTWRQVIFTVCQFGRCLSLNETPRFSQDKESFMSDDQQMIHISSRENYFCTIKVIYINNKIIIKSITTMSSQPQGSYLKFLFFKMSPKLR